MVGLVREGREEEVVEYLATADRNTEEWQRKLDECVVIAITNIQPEIMNHLVEAGAELDQLYTYKEDLEPLINGVLRSGNSTILDTFFTHFKCDIKLHVIISEGIDQLNAAVESKNLQSVKRAWSLSQELNPELGVPYLSRSLHTLVDFQSSTHDTSILTSTLEEILDFLLLKGCDIDCTDEDGNTPLHLAAQKGNMAGIRALMKYGADLFVRNDGDYYPWMEACEEEHYDIMQELLQGVAVDEHRERYESFLHEACKNGLEPAVRYLLDKGVDVNCTDDKNRTPLIITVESQMSSKIDVVKYLVNLCDVNYDSGAVMRSACNCLYTYYDEANHIYDIDERDDLHEIWASSINSDIESSLRKTEPTVRCLVQAGASMNLPDHNGHTLLMDSDLFREKRYRDLLLQCGADVNVVAEDGRSVLWTAVFCIDPNQDCSFDGVYSGFDYSLEAFYDDCYIQLSGLEDVLAQNIDIGVSQHQHEGRTPLQAVFDQRSHILCNILLDADCSLYGMSEYLSNIQEQVLGEKMEEVRASILKMCDQPYSLKAQARLAVLRAIGQCDLKEILHRIHHSRLLPKALVNYLGKAIPFNLDN